jgi:hypothetical protein
MCEITVMVYRNVKLVSFFLCLWAHPPEKNASLIGCIGSSNSTTAIVYSSV